MQPPGGGRNACPDRLVRHFNLIVAVEPDSFNLNRICNWERKLSLFLFR